MRVLIYLTSAVITACAVYMWSVRPVSMPLILYGNAVETILYSDVVLPDDTQKTYDQKFAKAKYFAAFAIAPDGRRGWAAGRHGPKDARAAALDFCNHGREGCEIYAELLPKGYDASINGVTVSQRALVGMKKYAPYEGSIEYALGETGAWAVQSSRDWSALAWLSVKWRCDTLSAKKTRPIFVPHGTCQAYTGPTYKVPD